MDDKQMKILQQEEKYEQMHTTEMILGMLRKEDSQFGRSGEAIIGIMLGSY